MALAQMRRAVRVAEQQRNEITEQQVLALTTASELSREEFDASEIRRYFSYERHLSRLAVEKDSQLAHLRTQEQGRQAELEDAVKSRRILERLKERKDKAYQFALGKEEQKRLDEAAVTRAAMADGPAKR